MQACFTLFFSHFRANILITKQYHAKLGDFGFAVELPRVVGDRSLINSESFARTEGYYPPELSEGRFGPKSDMYSYGIVSCLQFTKECLVSVSLPCLSLHMQS